MEDLRKTILETVPALRMTVGDENNNGAETGITVCVGDNGKADEDHVGPECALDKDPPAGRLRFPCCKVGDDDSDKYGEKNCTE